MGTEERKHLGLLDGVALLLVTEDKGDVAAASFSQTTGTITVFYAKKISLQWCLEQLYRWYPGGYFKIPTVVAGTPSMQDIFACNKAMH